MRPDSYAREGVCWTTPGGRYADHHRPYDHMLRPHAGISSGLCHPNRERRTMSEKENLLSKLEDEISHLEEKVVNLRKFVRSDKFKTLDSEHQILLERQLKAMDEYYFVLEERIALIEIERW